jgi:hypothetical protein
MVKYGKSLGRGEWRLMDGAEVFDFLDTACDSEAKLELLRKIAKLGESDVDRLLREISELENDEFDSLIRRITQ